MTGYFGGQSAESRGCCRDHDIPCTGTWVHLESPASDLSKEKEYSAFMGAFAQLLRQKKKHTGDVAGGVGDARDKITKA